MWDKYLESFIFRCKLKNLTQRSLYTYTERLRYLKEYLDANQLEIDKHNIRKYISSMIGVKSDVTVNGRIRVYKTFFKYLHEEGLIVDDPCQNLTLIKQEKKIRKVLTPDDITTILRSIRRKSFEGERDAVMIMVFYDAMVRRGEIINITLDDIHNNIIKVYGKGRKERFVPIGSRTVRALNLYLKRREKLPGSYLFCTSLGIPLTLTNCHHTIAKRGRAVGLKVYPHLIRHSAATQFLRSGGSPSLLQKILGHTSPIVTDIYTHLDITDITSAYLTSSPSNALSI